MKVVLGIIVSYLFVIGSFALILVSFLVSKDIELVLSDKELNI